MARKGRQFAIDADGSPTFDGFETAKKKSVSHSTDEGWNRCKSGFDEELIRDELVSISPWKVKKRKASKTTRSAKFTPIAASDLQVEGSEEEECIEEEPGDADIDWSSSEESNNNLSDVETLECDASPQLTPQKEKIREDKVCSRSGLARGKSPIITSDGETLECDASPQLKPQKEKIRKDQEVSTSSFGTTGKGMQSGKFGKWLLSKSRDQENVEIEDVKDNEQSATKKILIPLPGTQLEQLVSQASTTKTETNIDDYESSGDETQIPVSIPPIGSEPSQVTDSAQISELSPSPTEDVLAVDDTADTSTQITGTQWMKKFIQPVESPEKDEGDTAVANVVGAAGDSARKKKKFVKSGLAERLQKLINREKSSIAFWNHQLADMKKQPQDSTSTMVVEVLSMEHIQGMYVTKCTQLPSDQRSPDDGISTGGIQQQLFVLFSHNTGQNLKIAVGLPIRIYPPWQKLTIPNYSEPVILSTYFCQSLGCDDDAAQDEDDDTTSGRASTSAATFSPLKKPFQPLKLFEGIYSKPSSHTTPSGSLLESVTSMSDVKKVVSDSILDCIAESGAYTSSGMCVRARVQRVYCKRIKSHPLGLSRQHSIPSADHSVQWIMLLQDSHGVFCELQLPVDTATRPKWREHIQRGEGKVLTFSGVKVVHRTNRSRSPGLFSLIDSVSCHGDDIVGQAFSSQSESDTEDHALRVSKRFQGQNFCYTLGFQLGQGAIEDIQEDTKQVQYKLPSVCDLGELSQEANINQRISFYASVLHTCPETNIELPGQPASESSSTHNTGWHMLVSDTSLMRSEEESGSREDARKIRGEGSGVEYVYLHVRSGCVVNAGNWTVIGQFRSLVFCKDICVQQGGTLYADMYSAILKLDNNCQGCDRLAGCHQPQDGDIITKLSRVTMPTLPQLTNNSSVHTLVSATGTIIGVDESTAYSWPVCPVCANEKLQEQESRSQLMCCECNLPVTNPVIKMYLEVFLDCEASQEHNSAVKVKLLQSTIKSILPPLEEQEEGYDMQCILGQALQPTMCFLSNITVLPSGERCIELEEICVGDD
ncbi:DNA repair-scaffolding protein-like [Amphiura filiformis]|uniref:DNA repair-scaffolding protein-like n=1 Tax=Amphiura filiformis TaxID=82378 RepID=UPI003B210B26